MRLYREGDEGEPVRDIQDRLGALGHPCHPDPAGKYLEATRAAVTSFQRGRGLAADGIVGPDTWRALYEASYLLGDRLLHYRRPMLRGDDVAELQRQLNALGFDAGKVDGIFGPDTHRALIDFQHNRRMAEDGIAGPRVIGELVLVARATHKTGREAIREREWLRNLPDTVVGTRIFLDAGCRNPEERRAAWDAATGAALSLQSRGGVPVLARAADTIMPERVRAGRANRLGAELIVSFQHPVAADPGVYFFASAQSRSEAGAMLAAEVAWRLGLETDGRAGPLLKETQAPAIIVATADLDRSTGLRTVEGLAGFLARGARELPESGGQEKKLR